MWLPSDSTKSKFRWVEVAHYVKGLQAVIREKHPCEVCPDRCENPTDHKVPVLYDWENIYEYSQRYRHHGIYTSVFRYDRPDLTFTSRLANLYFDLDMDDAPEIAHLEAQSLYQYFRNILPDEAIRVYFTGSKGFHIELEAIALGADPGNDLASAYRFIAEHIEEELRMISLDFAVYDIRRMWRLPYSRHQKTKLYKNELPPDVFSQPLEKIQEYCKESRILEVPPQQFIVSANQWYHDLVGQQQERERENIQKRIDMFNRIGTGVIGKPSSRYAKIVWDGAMEALKEAGRINKDRNITLNQQGFRLYVLVEQGKLAEDYVTNRLTEVGLGIGLEELEVKRTLKSAQRAAKRKALNGEIKNV